MQSSEILAAIDEEISRLQQVRDLLTNHSGGHAKRSPRATVPATVFPFGLGNATVAPKKPRKMSAAGRARIAAAQKARWAKLKKVNAENKKNVKK
jgi:hypothetical protein